MSQPTENTLLYSVPLGSPMIKPLFFLLSTTFTGCVNVAVAFALFRGGTAVSRPLSRAATASETIVQSGEEDEKSALFSYTCHDLAWEEVLIAQEEEEASKIFMKRTTTTAGDQPSLSTATTEAERIQQGQSVIMLHNIVSTQECRDLAERCIQTAQDVHRSELEHHTTDNNNNEQPTLLVRMPCQAAARRAAWDKITCAKPLPEYIDYRVLQILQSVCQAIDANLPSVPERLFDTAQLGPLLAQSASSATNPEEDALVFSAREPAINVYSAPGGEFLPHKDGETLTVLLPLSSPGTDFQGGGTAFWSGGAGASSSNADSSITLKPMAGTALLFGGSVTHAGLPVTEGKRVVLVCSLSRRNEVARGDEQEGALESDDVDDDDDLSALLQSAAADWHDKWTSSELRGSCPDM